MRLHEQNWTRLGFFAVLKEMRLSPAVLELDSMVVNIELTLASIVQGVALTFLIENTRSVLSIHDAISWLYALTGLCIIFIFWSRSISARSDQKHKGHPAPSPNVLWL